MIWFEQAAILVSLITIAVPAFGQAKPFALERYRVTLKGGGLGVVVDETVIVSIVVNDGSRERWVAERLRRNHDFCAMKVMGQCSPVDTVAHEWIDGMRALL